MNLAFFACLSVWLTDLLDFRCVCGRLTVTQVHVKETGPCDCLSFQIHLFKRPLCKRKHSKNCILKYSEKERSKLFFFHLNPHLLFLSHKIRHHAVIRYWFLIKHCCIKTFLQLFAAVWFHTEHTHRTAPPQWFLIFNAVTLSPPLSDYMTVRTVRRQSSAPLVLLPRRSALATAPHWFLYYCSSHDDISHFVSSAFFLPLISIADYSASVGSDLMREPTELLLPSFTVIALCSPPAGPTQAASRAANNIDGGGHRHFDTSAEGCDW